MVATTAPVASSKTTTRSLSRSATARSVPFAATPEGALSPPAKVRTVPVTLPDPTCSSSTWLFALSATKRSPVTGSTATAAGADAAVPVTVYVLTAARLVTFQDPTRWFFVSASHAYPPPMAIELGIIVVAKARTDLAEPVEHTARTRSVVRREDLQVTLLRVGNPVIAGCRIDGHAAGPVEPGLPIGTRAEPASAALSEHSSARTGDDQPLIDRVDRDNVAGRVESDPAHLVVQRRRTVSRPHERARQRLGIRVSSGAPRPLLHAIAPEVGSPHVTVRVDGDLPELREGADLRVGSR